MLTQDSNLYQEKSKMGLTKQRHIGVLVFCGCFRKLSYILCIKIMKMNSLIVMEEKSLEKKKKRYQQKKEHTPSGGSRENSFLSLSASGGCWHFLASSVNDYITPISIFITTQLCPLCVCSPRQVLPKNTFYWIQGSSK